MRRLLSFLMLLCVSAISFAQMSDSQIIQFMQKEQKAGTAQSQIVTKLMQKGVKVEQVQRLRKKMASSMGSADETTELGDQSGKGKGNASRRTMGMNGGAAATTTAETGEEGAADEYGTAVGPAVASVDTVALFHGKKVFGRDIFNNKSLNFQPNMNIATPQNYVLGPGDQVCIDIYGASQKTEELTISPEGTIIVPNYGPIQVSGLTVAAAQNKIRSSLGTRYASSQLSVTLGQIRTIQVNVMGEVRVPGTYTLSAFATVFHALYMAGGTNSIGTLRNIRVFRQGKQVTSVDVYQYILSGRLAGNIRLQDNDVIQVGTYDCIVDVAGNVKRPMAFEMRKNESVKTLLSYAGGFTGNAYKKSVRLLRRSGKMKTVYNINEFDWANFKVDDGDSLFVDSMLDRYENTVEIKGAVFRSGMYRLGEEVTSVKTLIEAADGLLEEAFTNRAVIRRVKPNRTLEVLPVDVKGIMEGTTADIPLQNEDVLFIPTIQEHMTARTVTIQGEVQFPGSYEYADGETIEDFVLRAGGLTDAASVVKVDVSRRIRDAKATKPDPEISENFSFALKDGLVVDGTKSFTLLPYDVVQVRRSPNFVAPRNVSVEGEVVFSGNYTLAKKNQRLTDIIKAAGGVTDQAYVKGTRLERRLTAEEKARIEDAIEAAKLSATEKDSASMESIKVPDRYTVGINLEKALANPGSEFDVIVRDGDRLIVPEYSGTVKISGNVLLPNTVSYQKGKGWKYYVNQAGGFGARSKKSKAYIVYQNGMVSKASKGDIEPGCEIVVPRRAKRDTTDITQWISLGMSLTSLASMTIAISNLIK